MKKYLLTESQIQNIIKKCVTKALKEYEDWNADREYDMDDSDDENEFYDKDGNWDLVKDYGYSHCSSPADVAEAYRKLVYFLGDYEYDFNDLCRGVELEEGMYIEMYSRSFTSCWIDVDGISFELNNVKDEPYITGNVKIEDLDSNDKVSIILDFDDIDEWENCESFDDVLK